MNVKDVIKSQYHASLEMLKQAILKCPESVWDDQEQKNKFWHIAYHAIFYTHLYMHSSGTDFVSWEKGREQVHFMGQLPWPPHDEPEIGEAYSKEDVLEYLDLCLNQVDDTVDVLDLDGKSGFSWLPFSKMELQFYNIRHLMQHTGELCERLWAGGNIEVDWVGMRSG